MRSFRICVPDEWYRRSKSRNVSSASLEPSQSTIRRLAALQESDEDEDDEDDGTAKLSGDNTASPNNPDWRGSISPNRLSTLFDGWLRSPASESTHASFTPDNRKSVVSEPRLVEHRTGNALKLASNDFSTDDESDLDESAFEDMLVCSSSFALCLCLLTAV